MLELGMLESGTGVEDWEWQWTAQTREEIGGWE